MYQPIHIYLCSLCLYIKRKVYIYICMGRCLCFAPLLDTQGSAKKDQEKFEGTSSRQGGKPMKSDTILYYYSITLYHVGGTFQPTKRYFRSENRIAVLLSA